MTIEFVVKSKVLPGTTASTKKLCLNLFKHFSRSLKLRRSKARLPGQVDLVIVFLSPAKARKINATYRKKNYASDVLSFEPHGPGAGLGELVVCPAVLRKQARENGHSFKKELDYMVIHGFLHLLGYDHEKSRREELKMFKLQDKLFAKFSK